MGRVFARWSEQCKGRDDVTATVGGHSLEVDGPLHNTNDIGELPRPRKLFFTLSDL